MSYQGYSNFQTFIISLWINNDEGMQNYWLDLAEAIFFDSEPVTHYTRMDRATLTLAEQLKESWEESNPLSDEPSPYSDLLQSALSMVNWQELADELLSEIAEEFGEIEEDDEYDDDDEMVVEVELEGNRS